MNQQEFNTQLLNFMSQEKPDLDKISQIIKYGADVNYKNKKGKTPLMYAAEKGRKEIVNLLLENGADVNAADNFGNTALMYAAKNGDVLKENHAQIVKLLISKGANVNAGNKLGETALMHASYCGKNEEIVNILVKSGAIASDYDVLKAEKSEFNANTIELVKNAKHKTYSVTKYVEKLHENPENFLHLPTQIFRSDIAMAYCMDAVSQGLRTTFANKNQKELDDATNNILAILAYKLTSEADKIHEEDEFPTKTGKSK